MGVLLLSRSEQYYSSIERKIWQSVPKSNFFVISPRFILSFWSQNISTYGALMLLKFFNNWSRGFEVLKFFFRLSREPFEIR